MLETDRGGRLLIHDKSYHHHNIEKCVDNFADIVQA